LIHISYKLIIQKKPTLSRAGSESNGSLILKMAGLPKELTSVVPALIFGVYENMVLLRIKYGGAEHEH
jgi:hypothetical protein